MDRKECYRVQIDAPLSKISGYATVSHCIARYSAELINQIIAFDKGALGGAGATACQWCHRATCRAYQGYHQCIDVAVGNFCERDQSRAGKKLRFLEKSF